MQFQQYQWYMALEIAIRFLLIHITLTFLGMHICEKIIIEYQNYKLGRNLSQFIVFIIIELCYLKIQQKIDWCLNVFLKKIWKSQILAMVLDLWFMNWSLFYFMYRVSRGKHLCLNLLWHIEIYKLDLVWRWFGNPE